MPCKSTWYIENQVLFVHIWGDTDLDDYISYFQQSYEAYDQSDAPVIHTIVDASGVNKQANLIDVQRALPKTRHPRSGWTVTVKDGPGSVMARFVMTMVSKVLNLHFRHFDTLDEALEFLRHIDPNLDWDQARQSVLKLDSSTTG
ncbi:MAG TPA: hypothetical protein PLQ56_14175 [Aggregatilineales bacterium]|nr:hypothetical protein [Aggregatilineales bacterium]